MQQDPLQQAEKIVKEIHDKSGEKIQPVLRRYPLLFAFLVVFSVAAILHGFELLSDQIELLHEHPVYMILIGIILLFSTGMLYKALDKMD